MRFSFVDVFFFFGSFFLLFARESKFVDFEFVLSLRLTIDSHFTEKKN